MIDDRRVDEHSRTWKVVKEFCEAEIHRDRDALEVSGQPAETSEFLRGRIELARQILRLETHPPAQGR